MKGATIKKYGMFMAIIGVVLFLYLVYQRPVEGFQSTEARSVDLVVARYKENLDWLNKYKDSRFQNVYIYNKSDSPVEDCVNEYANCVIKTLPNVGMCDHTYLYHIIENYDSLADVTVFAPGSVNLDYKDSIFKFTTDKAFITKDTVLNTYKFDIDVDKAMYNFRMTTYIPSSSENRDQDNFNIAPASLTPFGVWYRKYFPEVHTPYSSFFGIFAASKEHIRQRPKSFYENMIQQVNKNIFPEGSHFIERAWFSIFWPLPEECIYISPEIVDIIDRLNGGFKHTRIVEGFSDNSIDITIYIVCYNEEILIAETIKHYRYRFPNATIYICDNYSTDRSTEIATNMGCQIIKWETTPENFEFKLTDLKNNVWKQSEGWVIVCDMDEWLCVDTAQLSKEDAKGATCLQVIGYDIVGNSNTAVLDDIDLDSLTYGFPKPEENKNLCFNTKYITEINYESGAHFSKPAGKVTFSESPYYLKHMDWLGLEYKQNKMKVRFERTKEMQKLGMATHYTNDMNKVKDTYSKNIEKARDISNILYV
jgi:hypothetical protein